MQRCPVLPPFPILQHSAAPSRISAPLFVDQARTSLPNCAIASLFLWPFRPPWLLFLSCFFRPSTAFSCELAVRAQAKRSQRLPKALELSPYPSFTRLSRPFFVFFFIFHFAGSIHRIGSWTPPFVESADPSHGIRVLFVLPLSRPFHPLSSSASPRLPLLPLSRPGATRSRRAASNHISAPWGLPRRSPLRRPVCLCEVDMFRPHSFPALFRRLSFVRLLSCPPIPASSVSGCLAFTYFSHLSPRGHRLLLVFVAP